MERYIQQLKEDIYKSIKDSDQRREVLLYTEAVDEFDHLVDLDISDEDGIKLSRFVGLDKMYLPALELLSDAQSKIVAQHLVLLLEAYLVFPHFNNNVTWSVMYLVLRDNWDMPIFPDLDDVLDLEFCDFDPNDCPYGFHCALCVKTSIEEDDSKIA